MPASLELVKIALQAYGNGDCEIALALADPLIRWDERASRPDGDLVWGHEDVERAMRRYLDSWGEYHFDLEDIAEVAPGKIVGICRERGRDANGVSVDRRFGGLWVVEAGKIASWSTYLTPKEAVRAAREASTRFESEQSPALTPEERAAVERGGRSRAKTDGPPPKPPAEEQKRAKARAKLRRRASRQTA